MIVGITGLAINRLIRSRGDCHAGAELFIQRSVYIDLELTAVVTPAT